MAEIPYKPPEFEVTAFNCPHCNAYAKQDWQDVKIYQGGYHSVPNMHLAFCSNCGDFSIWLSHRMLHPSQSGVLPPNSDLGDEVMSDYQEAADIAARSPRGAAALLRLAIQKLCIQLGLPGNDLNTDIAALVKRGLDDKIRKALDFVRVVGNNALHPGVIDLRDDPQTASKLFVLVNIIGRQMISEPKEVEDLYYSLPEKIKEQVSKRDS